MLVPLLMGIGIGYYAPDQNLIYFLFSLSIGAFIAHKCSFFKKNIYFGISLYTLVAAMGVCLTIHQVDSIKYPWSKTEQLYCGTIKDEPQIKEKSVCHTVQINYIYSAKNRQTKTIDRSILLYLPSNAALNSGDKIYFFGKINPPQNNGNPNEFDYASYLLNKGISGSAYIYEGSWRKAGHEARLSLSQEALKIRSKLIAHFDRIPLSKDDRAVLNAITLGYQADLSEGIKDNYSISGVSHILSLSGLHIGFLYALLLLLLKPLDKIRGGKTFKQLFIIILMWVFAFITGLMPPVLRTVIMFTIMALGQLFSTRPITLNTLAATAFIMLIMHPLNMFDVSFQLSFMAVAGILVIMPLWKKWWQPHNRAVKYVWDLSGVSISAQAATIPFLLYYFHNLPTYFILTNLLVIFLSSLLMYAAATNLLFFFIAPVQLVTGWLLSLMLKLLNGITAFMSHLPYSSIDHIYLSAWQIGMIASLIVAWLLFITKRSVPRLASCLVGITFLFALQTHADYTDKLKQEIVFFNNRKGASIQFILPNRISYLFSSSHEPKEQFIKAHKDFIYKNKLYPPISIAEGMHTGFINAHNHIIHFGNKTIGIVGDKRWAYKASRHPLNIDYLVITRGYYGKIVYLTGLFNIKQVVVDGSVYANVSEKVMKECKGLGIKCINLNLNGAYISKINNE